MTDGNRQDQPTNHDPPTPPSTTPSTAKPRSTNLYVKASDVPLWDQAAKIAHERGTSLSAVVSEALGAYISALPTKPLYEDRTITVDGKGYEYRLVQDPGPSKQRFIVLAPGVAPFYVKDNREAEQTLFSVYASTDDF